MADRIKNELKAENEHVFWTISKSLSFLVAVIAVSLKLYNSTFDFKMDVPTLLSILLALFSVGLSALFYFKATDTSNKFYDNSYKYTKDVAQLLVKIESGFGERLKKLDEGYLSVREEIKKIPVYGQIEKNDFKTEIENTKKSLLKEKEELEKINKDKQTIISTMMEKSQLENDEKESILSQLRQKESEASEAQNQVSKLNKRLFAERMNKKEANFKNSVLHKKISSFTLESVVNDISPEVILRSSHQLLNRYFTDVTELFGDKYFKDMTSLGYFDDEIGLTKKGARFIRDLAREITNNEAA